MACYIKVNNKPKMIFDFIVILSTLIYCMKIIYQLCFFGFSSNYNESLGDKIFDFIIFALNAVYIILNFFHSYIDKSTGETIIENKKIVINYLKGWFCIDFISSFPFELIWEKSSFLKLLRIIRINKIFLFISFVERVSLKTRQVIALFRLAFFGVFGTFFFACCWYLNSYFNKTSHPQNNFIKYYNLYNNQDQTNSTLTENTEIKGAFHSMLICFFFTLTTVTTTGFGDYVAQNVPERIFSAILMLFGVLYFSFLMSLLMEEINIVGDENQTVEAQKLITQLRKFNKGKTNLFIGKKINKAILHDVVFASKHSRYEQITKKENFDILPRKIKNELSNYLWKDVFRQIYDYYDFLQEDKNLHTILCKLSYYFIFKYYQAKELIYSIDKLVTEINLIQSGYVDIINYKVNLKKRLKPGDGMGIFYILYNVRPIYAYLAASGVEVISISDESFYKVLNKEDEKYLIKFKRISLTRFKEIFHQINSSKKRKKDIINEDKENEILIENKKDEQNINLQKGKDNKELKDYELEYKGIKRSFYKLVNNENYLLGNIYQNESLTSEYKKSFQLEEFIISELNKNK
jgi:hypothetical protein